MVTTREDLPENVDGLKAALLTERARAARVEAELAIVKAKASDDQAVIAHQQLQIAKLTRQLYGQHSERTVRLLDQMELTFEELESSATEDEIAAEGAAAKTTNVVAFTRRRPARQPFPEHLPRERVVEPGPAACLCCGSTRLREGRGACARPGRGRLPVLGRHAAAQAERGHHRDAGGDPASMEGDPACPREVHLPRLREDQPGSGTIPCDRARLGRSHPAGDDPVREVRTASATEPPSRTLRQRGGAAQPVDPGRPGGRVLRGAGTAPQAG